MVSETAYPQILVTIIIRTPLLRIPLTLFLVHPILITPVIPGRLLVMFTDGVVEAPNRDGEEFGEQRLIDVLLRLDGAPLPKIVGAVLEELRGWIGDGAPAHDDVTLVLARAR